MKCWICNADNWHLRDDLNPTKKVGICKECGCITFIIADGEEQKMIEFYRKNYRTKPNNQSLITTTNKLNYIKIFLAEFLKDKKELICGDIGAATGYVCNWLRSLGHKATGSEYTLTYRRFSEHYYGIPLTEELEPKHKYDLLIMYHTLEHMVNPTAKLNYHASLLSDNGVIMISVPEWLNECENLAQVGKFTIENYFHENHINCFTRNSFNNLMNICGLEYVKQDYEQYGMTMLVKKGQIKPIIKEDWNKINNDIDKIKTAIKLFTENKFKEACEVWQNFPDAHLRLIFDLYRKDPSRQEAYFAKLKDVMPNKLQVKQAQAVWYYQFDKLDESLKLFQELIENKPCDEVFIYTGYILERMGKYQEAMRMFATCMNINPKRWTECTDIMCSISSKMSAWDERAEEQIKEQLYSKVKEQVQLKDPVMETTNEPA